MTCIFRGLAVPLRFARHFASSKFFRSYAAPPEMHQHLLTVKRCSHVENADRRENCRSCEKGLMKTSESDLRLRLAARLLSVGVGCAGDSVIDISKGRNIAARRFGKAQNRAQPHRGTSGSVNAVGWIRGSSMLSSNPKAISCSIAAEVESIDTPRSLLPDFKNSSRSMMFDLRKLVA